MKHKRGFILIIIGLLMISSAFGLLIYNRWDNKRAELVSKQVLELLKKEITSNPDTYLEEMKVVEIDGYGYIGTIGIPAFEFELPVMSTWDDERLKIAPSRHFGNLNTNDLVIAGHNYESHFRVLWYVKEGDILIFTDMDNRKTAYEVKSVEVLDPYATDIVKNSPWDIVLYTCTYGAKDRVIVGAKKIIIDDSIKFDESE